MVSVCQELGLPVKLADASDYLEAEPDQSIGSIFASQVVEHLSLEELQRLLRLALLKLKTNGLFIAETINPHNLAAMKTFWVDLTHRQPIFPEVALTLCATAGFGSAYVFAPGYDDFEAARFHSPSYAVVASPDQMPA
jgi:O-antigen chain-terminating methyltransferase